MRHPFRWIFGLIAVVVLAAVGFGAWYVFGSSAPAKPKLSATATTVAGGPTTPTGSWKIALGDNVYLGYRIKELFADSVVKRDAVGRTPDMAGIMRISGPAVTAATVTAQMQHLKSDRGTRDNYIHTHAIESDKFPTAVFRLTAPIELPQPLVKGAKVSVDATGKLTLHGVTNTVTVPLEARWTGPTIEVVGTVPISLPDYRIDAPDTGVVSVDDKGSLELSLTFIRASDG
jgi:polyisoprenoid-binding protein YceI